MLIFMRRGSVCIADPETEYYEKYKDSDLQVLRSVLCVCIKFVCLHQYDDTVEGTQKKKMKKSKFAVVRVYNV